MTPEYLAILMFLALLAAIFLGHPLAFALGSLAVWFGAFAWGGSLDVVFSIFANKNFTVMSDFVLVAAPLFIFMANMLDVSGIATGLFHSLFILLGPIRGGLGVAVIGLCTVFACSSGVVGATEMAVGLLAVPALLKKNYNIPLVAGAICAGGTLGILIPPSIMLVFFASLANLSVGHLYAAAFMPGLLLATLYIVFFLAICGINPKLGPPLPKEDRIYSWGQKIKMVSYSMLPPMVVIVLVLGSLIAGVATSTEAAGMGAFGAFVLAGLYGKLNWNVIKQACISTCKVNSMILSLVVAGNCFQAVFIGLGGGEVMGKALLGLQLSPMGVVFVMMAVVFILGCFLDWIAILLIVVPIFMPVVQELEQNVIWFSTLICVNLQMAYLTPPFGMSMFYLKGIAPPEMTMAHIYKGVVPFVALQWIGLLLCMYFPRIILWIPQLIFGIDAIK
jgi:tripartite ATP-independent transporter DctM subunit